MNDIHKRLMRTGARHVFYREIPVIAAWLTANGFKMVKGSEIDARSGKYSCRMSRKGKHYTLVAWYGTSYDNYIVLDEALESAKWHYVAMIWKGGELHADLLGAQCGQYLTFEECMPKEAR